MFYIRQKLRRGVYGQCLVCDKSFEDLVTHVESIRDGKHKLPILRDTTTLIDSQTNGRIFVHRKCGRMIRVSRDWDHKNPQATEPPDHPECYKVVEKARPSGLGTWLVREDTGAIIDTMFEGLPAINSYEYEEIWEDVHD